MLVKSIEVECGNPLIRNRVRQSPICAYMDDLTVLGCCWILLGLEKIIAWERMKLKWTKSKVTGIEVRDSFRKVLV